MKSVVLALCTVLLAPYQCGTRATNRPTEDTAPGALWTLAERFETDGDAKAREVTLRTLAENYPHSRFGKRARIELGMPEPEPPTDDEQKQADKSSDNTEESDDES